MSPVTVVGRTLRAVAYSIVIAVFAVICGAVWAQPASHAAPLPLLAKDHPVDWWFVFKFNASSFPGCGGTGEERACPFGGQVQKGYTGYGQQFVYASSESSALKK